VKLTASPSKIVGVQLGEAMLNLIRPGEPPIRAKFALLTKDETVAGFVDVSSNWSDKALNALQAFTEAMEEEAMRLIFEAAQPSETPAQPEERNEPPQF
jgi:hypothetical protein